MISDLDPRWIPIWKRARAAADERIGRATKALSKRSPDPRTLNAMFEEARDAVREFNRASDLKRWVAALSSGQRAKFELEIEASDADR